MKEDLVKNLPKTIARYYWRRIRILDFILYLPSKKKKLSRLGRKPSVDECENEGLWFQISCFSFSAHSINLSTSFILTFDEAAIFSNAFVSIFFVSSTCALGLFFTN